MNRELMTGKLEIVDAMQEMHSQQCELMAGSVTRVTLNDDPADVHREGALRAWLTPQSAWAAAKLHPGDLAFAFRLLDESRARAELRQTDLLEANRREVERRRAADEVTRTAGIVAARYGRATASIKKWLRTSIPAQWVDQNELSDLCVAVAEFEGSRSLPRGRRTAPPSTSAEFWALPVVENQRRDLVYIKAEGALFAGRDDSGDWWGLDTIENGWARTKMAGPPFP